MKSPSDKLRKLVEELRPGTIDSYSIMLEGKANEFYMQFVDPYPRSLGEAYLKGSIDAIEFVTRRLEGLLWDDECVHSKKGKEDDSSGEFISTSKVLDRELVKILV